MRDTQTHTHSQKPINMLEQSARARFSDYIYCVRARARAGGSSCVVHSCVSFLILWGNVWHLCDTIYIPHVHQRCECLAWLCVSACLCVSLCVHIITNVCTKHEHECANETFRHTIFSWHTLSVLPLPASPQSHLYGRPLT